VDIVSRHAAGQSCIVSDISRNAVRLHRLRRRLGVGEVRCGG